MDWIIDASVLIQAYINEPDSRRVYTLLQGLKKTTPDRLHVPEFCLLECSNILWKHVRFHGLARDKAVIALHRMRALPLIVYQANPLLPRGLEIGLDHQLAVYDSIYLALAEQINHPLISADAPQQRIAGVLRITLKPLSDFPEYNP